MLRSQASCQCCWNSQLCLRDRCRRRLYAQRKTRPARNTMCPCLLLETSQHFLAPVVILKSMTKLCVIVRMYSWMFVTWNWLWVVCPGELRLNERPVTPYYLCNRTGSDYISPGLSINITAALVYAKVSDKTLHDLPTNGDSHAHSNTSDNMEAKRTMFRPSRYCEVILWCSWAAIALTETMSTVTKFSTPVGCCDFIGILYWQGEWLDLHISSLTSWNIIPVSPIQIVSPSYKMQNDPRKIDWKPILRRVFSSSQNRTILMEGDRSMLEQVNKFWLHFGFEFWTSWLFTSWMLWFGWREWF